MPGVTIPGIADQSAKKNSTFAMSEVVGQLLERSEVENSARSTTGVTTMTISALAHAMVVGDEMGSYSWMR